MFAMPSGILAKLSLETAKNDGNVFKQGAPELRILLFQWFAAIL